MDYFGLSALAKTGAALVALAAIPAIGLWLARPLLSLAGEPTDVAGVGARTRFVFQVATLPALAAVVLIIPFRVPRELIEVVVLPVVVTITGIVWIQAGAWLVSDVRVRGAPGTMSVARPLIAVLTLLLVFQLLLRPGIHFY
jgi:hypothetical protein